MFFEWIDDPLCNRAKQIIPGLLKKLNEEKFKTKNQETLIDKLEDMTRILEMVNSRLEEENKALKVERKKRSRLEEENKALKEERKKRSRNMKMLVILFCCWCLIKLLIGLMYGGSNLNHKMIV
ncbi:hypothetical protein ACS0TY_003002 [Phlomoides rotata]